MNLNIQDDKESRKMMIEDWEIGALFWNCLYRAVGDEQTALNMVKQKYLEEFADKDLHLFLGTTLRFHAMSAPNPFVIIGAFYLPQTPQLSFL